jgi:hypothetical protein
MVAGGTSLVVAAQPSGKSNAGQNQYAKPGCGPDKTDGVAGNSGRHQGQPPKDQNRGDCPNPPGQQNKTQQTAAPSQPAAAQGNKKK